MADAASDGDETFKTDEHVEQLSAQGYIPHTELYGGLWSNVRSALIPIPPKPNTNGPRSIKA